MPTIVPDPGQEQDVARRLLAQADDPSEVGTDTQGPRTGFVVSDELAAKAGFEATEEPGDDTGSDPAGSETPDQPASGEETGAKEPPRSGAGSGEDAWRAFLTEQNIDAPEDASRADLIALWDNR